MRLKTRVYTIGIHDGTDYFPLCAHVRACARGNNNERSTHNNPRNTDFWHLVRNQCGNSKSSSCNVIDGLTTDDGISNMFSSKICSILNSDSDHLARESFLENLTDSISNDVLLSSEISSATVINALDQLKKGNLNLMVLA